MMNSNGTCTIRPDIGADVFGRTSLGPAVKERCGIVRMKQLGQETPLRSEASASKGHAWEFIQQNRILLSASTKATNGSRIDLLGMSFRVVGLSPCVDAVTGKIDHYLVMGDVWA